MQEIRNRLESILGARGVWLAIFILFCGSVYFAYLDQMKSTIVLSTVIILFLWSSFLRVQSFGGNNKTLWWILLPPVFLGACLILKKRAVDEEYSANAAITNAFLTITVSTFVIGLLSVYLIGKWTDKNEQELNSEIGVDDGKPLEKPSYEDCYKNGVEYFANIGVIILTSPPDAGKFATDVAKERCRRNTLAFGS